jgi:hypothetical protein
MHSYDFALLLAFFAIVLLPAPWLGRFYFKVMEGQRTWLSPVLGPVEQAAIGWRGERQPGAELAAVHPGPAGLQPGRLPAAVRRAAVAGLPAAQPAAPAWPGMVAGVQHRRQLRHQHQLAGLQR